jgi:hypothetical protein
MPPAPFARLLVLVGLYAQTGRFGSTEVRSIQLATFHASHPRRYASMDAGNTCTNLLCFSSRKNGWVVGYGIVLRLLGW